MAALLNTSTRSCVLFRGCVNQMQEDEKDTVESTPMPAMRCHLCCGTLQLVVGIPPLLFVRDHLRAILLVFAPAAGIATFELLR